MASPMGIPPQDMAAGIVARLVDASRPTRTWPLLQLLQQLAALANQAPLGREPDVFQGGW